MLLLLFVLIPTRIQVAIKDCVIHIFKLFSYLFIYMPHSPSFLPMALPGLRPYAPMVLYDLHPYKPTGLHSYERTPTSPPANDLQSYKRPMKGTTFITVFFC